MTPIPSPAASGRGTTPLAVFLFLCVGAFGCVQPLTTVYLEAAGLSRAQIGWVAGAGTALAFLAQIPLGRLSDRMDARRPLMAAITLLAAAAYVLHLFAHGVPAFALLTAFGVTANLYPNAAAGAIAGRLAAQEGGGGGAAYYARLRAWGSVGYVVVALSVGLLAQRFLPSGPAARLDRAALAPLFAVGPLLFVAAAVAALFVPDPKAREASSVVDAAPPPRLTKGTDGADLRWFLLAYFLFFFAMNGALAYLSLFLKSLGATPLGITATWATGVVCEALVMSRIGSIADRYGRRPALLVCFAALPIRLLLYAAAPGPAAVALTQMLEGLNFGIIGALSVAFVNDLAPEQERGMAQARLAAVMGLALATAPVAAGWVAEEAGLRGLFVALALIAVVAALLFYLCVAEPHANAKPLPRFLRVLSGAPPRRRRKGK
jgi:PPP family 3-phenylpropionic acid transporter